MPIKKSIAAFFLALWLWPALAPAACGWTAGELEARIGKPPKFAVFHFPKEVAIAEILIAKKVTSKAGIPVMNYNRVLARGDVSLPTNSELQINLRFDGLERMDKLLQLKDCMVMAFCASNLDFEDRHMLYIKDFKKLAHLDLADTLITDKSLPEIGTFTNLRILSLIKTNVTGSEFDSLKNLSKLLELSLEGTDLKPGNIFKLKPIMGHLILFRINRVNLTKSDAAILKDLKDISDLIICNNSHIDNDCVKYFSACKKLRELDISDTSINENALPLLLKLPSLVDVRVRDKTFWRRREHLPKYGKLAITDISEFSEAPTEVFKPLH